PHIPFACRKPHRGLGNRPANRLASSARTNRQPGRYLGLERSGHDDSAIANRLCIDHDDCDYVRESIRECCPRAGGSMKPMVMIGAALSLLGVLALASPVFTTNQTKNVATIGDLKIQANEQTAHAIPPILSGAALIVGLVLLGGGLYQ